MIDNTLDILYKAPLNMIDNPYDNAVVEAIYKFDHLVVELSDRVNWFNTISSHSPLNYFSPKEYEIHTIKKVPSFLLTNKEK